MKKLFTYLFLILFSFQTSSLGSDISDVQIEGISIGHSLLDYYSEEEIIKAEKKYYLDFKSIISQTAAESAIIVINKAEKRNV